ncbi:MAG TPA: hypothetical protein VGF08_07935 [Terriglobales bacterium]|jgi:hypothetical protein
MPNRTIALAIALCLLMPACSRRDFLTRAMAGELIAASEAFKTPQQFFMRTGITSNREFSSPEYLVLQRRGWITGVNVACTPDVSPPPCWDVALTPIGVETFRELIPADAKSRQYFPIPTAHRELVTVTGITKNDNLADVDFTWHWTPTNEVGAALVPGGVSFQSTVGFKHYDDGWRLVEGTASKSNQNLDDALKAAEPAR